MIYFKLIIQCLILVGDEPGPAVGHPDEAAAVLGAVHAVLASLKLNILATTRAVRRGPGNLIRAAAHHPVLESARNRVAALLAASTTEAGEDLLNDLINLVRTHLFV